MAGPWAKSSQSLQQQQQATTANLLIDTSDFASRVVKNYKCLALGGGFFALLLVFILGMTAPSIAPLQATTCRGA